MLEGGRAVQRLYWRSAPEWRNWQTQETQNLPPVTRRVGSIPSSGTNLDDFESPACAQETPVSSCRSPGVWVRFPPQAPTFAPQRSCGSFGWQANLVAKV